MRFLSGDTDKDDRLVEDEEIDFLLEESSNNTYSAAAMVCESLASKFAREVAHSGDGLSFSGDQLKRQFEERAASLRKMANRRRGPVEPYVGGISWDERRKADQDADKIPTHFRSHQHDHPETNTEGGVRPRIQGWP